MAHAYKLLGTLEIRENGRLSPVMKRTKGCGLLVYLIVTNQSHSRAHLASLLWNETTMAASLRNLRQAIHAVRKHIPDLSVTRQSLSLHIDPTTDIDYVQVRAALNQDDVETLDWGLRRYSGHLLATYYVAEAPRFNKWLTLAREALRAEVVNAYRRLCQAYETQAAWKAGIDAARRWVALDDLDEEAQRHLMQLLAANSQTKAALQQYETCRSRLWEELGVEPEKETAQLADAIKQRHASREMVSLDVDKTAVSPWQPAPRPDPDTLPEPGRLPTYAVLPYQRNNDFTGREAELLQLGRWLLPQGNTLPQPLPKGGEPGSPPKGGRVVAITGIGGLGKTQLAVEFAYRYGRFFAGGVYWLSFADPESVAEEIANIGNEQSMGLFASDDDLTLSDRVGRVQRAWQEVTPRLLIFDNCEDEQLLQKWLPVSGGCRVLLTSRRGLWSTQLNINVLTLHRLARQESISFLNRLIAKISHKKADEVAAEVGDLPLALHLAGSFLQRNPKVSATRYLNQLRKRGSLQHPSLLGKGVAPSPTGHEHHVARTFALNFEQLEAKDDVDGMARLLLACAISLAHGEPIPQALLLDAVMADPDDLMAELLAVDGLARLATLGILTLTGNETAQIHRLVATYAAVELGEMVVQGQTAVSTALIKTLVSHQERDPYLQALPIATAHLLHVVEAAKMRNEENAALLSQLLGEHFLGVSNYRAAQIWLEAGLTLAQLHNHVDTLAVALAHLQLGRLKLATADYKAAQHYLGQAMPSLERLGASAASHLAEARVVLGGVLEYLGEPDQAQQQLEQALLSYEQLTEPNLEKVAHCYLSLSNLATARGDYNAALPMTQKALATRQQFYGQEHRMVALALSALGSDYFTLGRFAEGKQKFEQAATMIEKLLGPEHPDVVVPLSNLGVMEWRIGDFNAAHRHFRQVLQICEKNLPPDHPRLADALNDVAEALCQLGDFDQAKAYHKRALAIRRAKYGETHYETMRSLSMLGEVYLRQGAHGQAQTTLERALSVQEQVEQSPQAISDTLILLGETYLAQGELVAAEPVLRRALAVREKAFGRDNSETAVSRFQLGKWYEAVGNVASARRHYEAALATLEKTVTAEHPNLQRVRVRLEGLG